MSEKTSNGLLPCPFCGGKPEINTRYDVIDWVNDEPIEELRYVVECENDDCPCWVLSKMYPTAEMAAKFWNTRKPMEYAVERIEKKRLRVVGFDSNLHYIYKEGADWMAERAIKIVKEEGGVNDNTGNY